MKQIQNENGTSLIEVLVVFTIVIIGISIYTKTLMSANRMMVTIQDKLESYQEFVGAYYLEELNPIMKNDILELVGEDGTVHELPVIIRKFQTEAHCIYDVIGAQDELR